MDACTSFFALLFLLQIHNHAAAQFFQYSCAVSFILHLPAFFSRSFARHHIGIVSHFEFCKPATISQFCDSISRVIHCCCFSYGSCINHHYFEIGNLQNKIVVGIQKENLDVAQKEMNIWHYRIYLRVFLHLFVLPDAKHHIEYSLGAKSASQKQLDNMADDCNSWSNG